jgi:branched-chain amino acid transport system permease protein
MDSSRTSYAIRQEYGTNCDQVGNDKLNLLDSNKSRNLTEVWGLRMTLPAGSRNYSYDDEMATFRTRPQKVLLVLALILLFCAPFRVSGYWLGILSLMGITIIAATGLNLITGYCGQLSFGHAGFIAVGAYTSAILTGRLHQTFFVGLICAGLLAGTLGALSALPAWKVKGWRLAVSTMAVQFIIIWVINHWTDVTGGTDGLKVSGMSIAGIDFITAGSQFVLIMIITILTIFFANNLARTRTGRAFTGIRDNERAAQANGVNLFGYKLLAFFVGCAMAGTAGALLAHSTGNINGGMFGLTQSMIYVGILIIGGFGTMLGPVLGAIIVVLLTNQLAPAIEGTNLLPAQFASDLAPMLVGIVVILFLILLPRGLTHYRPFEKKEGNLGSNEL